jgi:hypothetical protein
MHTSCQVRLVTPEILCDSANGPYRALNIRWVAIRFLSKSCIMLCLTQRQLSHWESIVGYRVGLALKLRMVFELSICVCELNTYSLFIYHNLFAPRLAIRVCRFAVTSSPRVPRVLPTTRYEEILPQIRMVV